MVQFQTPAFRQICGNKYITTQIEIEQAVYKSERPGLPELYCIS